MFLCKRTALKKRKNNVPRGTYLNIYQTKKNKNMLNYKIDEKDKEEEGVTPEQTNVRPEGETPPIK